MSWEALKTATAQTPLRVQAVRHVSKSFQKIGRVGGIRTLIFADLGHFVPIRAST